jgi:flagellin-like protein
MDKVITTALLIVVSMVLAVVLFNSAYPAVTDSAQAISVMAGRTDDRLRSQIAIIQVASETDRTGWWQDVDGNGYFDVFTWVKNVGSTRIFPVEAMDVFFGPEGNFVRIPAASQAGQAYPRWTGQIENGSQWTPTATLKITISYAKPLPAGRYFVKVAAPNGVSAEDYVSW